MKKSLGANTLLYPAPVWVVCSYDSEGRPNAMTSSWAGICSSKPASVMVALRKATHSYGSIMERRAFTVNIPSADFAAQTDYFGLVSRRDTDKFSDTGLTAERSALVDAPYIKEFPLVIECRLSQSVEQGLHTMFIGEIADVKADEGILGGDGIPDIAKLRPMLFAPGTPPSARQYFAVGEKIGPAFSIGSAFRK